jgi:hypothetical protein
MSCPEIYVASYIFLPEPPFAQSPTDPPYARCDAPCWLPMASMPSTRAKAKERSTVVSVACGLVQSSREGRGQVSRSYEKRCSQSRRVLHMLVVLYLYNHEEDADGRHGIKQGAGRGERRAGFPRNNDRGPLGLTSTEKAWAPVARQRRVPPT